MLSSPVFNEINGVYEILLLVGIREIDDPRLVLARMNSLLKRDELIISFGRLVELSVVFCRTIRSLS
jgi:hypothetical protein